MNARPESASAYRIDSIGLLRRYLQVLAFCLAIAALQYFARPDESYEVPLIYSLFIGSACWALIDIGRFLFHPDPETGWPRGWRKALLLTLGAVGGNLVGIFAADLWFGWSSWQQSLSQQRLSWLVSLLAGGAVIFYFNANGRSRRLQRQTLRAQQQATEAKLKLLQTQLEPHMLFNTLANLRVLIASDPARAQQMLDHLIDYLRATLGASRAATHALSAEFERLADYLELMAVRMGPRLRYTLDLPPELADHPVPTLLLQPLVENSIRHGLEPKVEGGSIQVSARRDGDSLLLEVADTGVGLQAGAEGLRNAGTGFGVAQVRERLGTVYHDGGTIDFVANGPSGTRAIIRLPYENPSKDQNRSAPA